jgi:glutaredoxin
MPMSDPIVYTVSTCPACLKLKSDWRQQGIKFEERPTDQEQKWLDEALKYGESVPIVVYPEGRVTVGYQNMIG